MKAKVKRKVIRIRTEKEIRDRLARALEDLEWLKKEYLNTSYADKRMIEIFDDITYVEAEVKTLRWVLCD